MAQREVYLRGLLPHLLYEPHDRTRPYPLMLFLHGAAETGTELDLVKKHGPPKVVPRTPLPFFRVISPQCPPGFHWVQLLDDLRALLEDAFERYPVDRTRVYLTGLSIGGYGSWYLASAYPELFAALVPICGGGDTSEACNLKDIPTWAFHGARDDVVPPAESIEMVEALKACGGDVRLTLYPNLGHNSWTRTYNNMELYAWLLRHRKGSG
jgi:predicted peptidase